jgi:hypothetical protein
MKKENLICNIHLTEFINDISNKDSKYAWEKCMKYLKSNEYVEIQNKKYLNYHCGYEALIRCSNYEEYSDFIIKFVNHVSDGALFNLTSEELKLLFSDYYNNTIQKGISDEKICRPHIKTVNNEEEYEMCLNEWWFDLKDKVCYINCDELTRIEIINNIKKDERECFKYFYYLRNKKCPEQKYLNFDFNIENSIVEL